MTSIKIDVSAILTNADSGLTDNFLIGAGLVGSPSYTLAGEGSTLSTIINSSNLLA